MEFDPQQIGEAIEVAGQSTKTLRGALDVAQRVKKLFSDGSQNASDTELQALVGELAEQLMQARMANLEVVTKLQALQLHFQREDETREKLSNYAPFTLPQGGRVLRLREDLRVDEDWEVICPICANRTRELIPLQGSWKAIDLKCPLCKSAFPNQSSFAEPTVWHYATSQ
ncbi:hypothetical protein [Mameliella sp.]|uniref:hypothetical protein n=1 Tax=Mameliella sp. TaxID=1924940 RepID=UPI003B5102ED